MNLVNPDLAHCAKMLGRSKTVAMIGNGGNLSIAQHAASDINRHTGKLCLCPDATHLTALAGDDLWHGAWLAYAVQHCDMILGISARVNSPMIRDIDEFAFGIPTTVIAPKKINSNHIDTIVLPCKTYHEFEVNALWTIYMMMEYNGVKLPDLP